MGFVTSNKVIIGAFYLLFFLTPLVWAPRNFELFEYNKMMFVYFMTIIITTAWVHKMIQTRSLIFKRTILDLPLFIFLISQVLSTIFSIDPHTSIWGYYSRSNGGLLSTASYLLLYFAFVSNIESKQVPRMLLAAVTSAAVISLWAISEHFGVSPSCVILRGEFNVDCWIQKVQERVFATLGQPNWLAAYLAMLIFPTTYFLLTAQKRWQLYTFYFILFTLYLAFTFTYSNGGTVGFLAATLVTIISLGYTQLKKKERNLSYLKPFFFVLSTFLIINLIFGAAPTRRFQLSNLIPQTPPPTNQPSQSIPQGGSQLENGGAETGKIRLIVWQGALEVFKHYPILGSGVETFAYSYYNFRPPSHNLTTEWDFLYNKAHNEYLNYLATTGLVGTLPYLALIFTFIFWCCQYLYRQKKLSKQYLLTTFLLASYISFLLQNFFGFSVVIIALLFYLFPALTFVYNQQVTQVRSLQPIIKAIPLGLRSLNINSNIYTLALIIIYLIAAFLAFSLVRFWNADMIFALGVRNSEAGNAGRAYNLLSTAVQENGWEPFYRSELGFTAASAALALSDTDATLSAALKEQSLRETQLALSISPRNVSFWRTAIRTYYQLAALDPKFNQKTLDTIDETIKLAPTDPKLYYNKAIILGQMDKSEPAIDALKKAVELKPNYKEAYVALGLFYFDQKEIEKAVYSMNQALKSAPNDPEVLNRLIDWGKKGVATQSSQL